ncbi:hypothetical protein [Comamonas sp. JC664]
MFEPLDRRQRGVAVQVFHMLQDLLEQRRPAPPGWPRASARAR